MCTQCCVDAEYFLLDKDGNMAEDPEILPGWMLFRAAKDSTGSDMKKGQWGLVRCNDPDYVWDEDPIIDPTFGMTESQEKCFFGVDAKDSPGVAQANLFMDLAIDFRGALRSCANDPDTGWELVEAAKKRGFDPEKGLLSFWLFHRMGEWISKYQPLAHDDPRLPDYWSDWRVEAHKEKSNA